MSVSMAPTINYDFICTCIFSTLPSDCLFLFGLLLILGEEKILLALHHKHSLVPRPRLYSFPSLPVLQATESWTGLGTRHFQPYNSGLHISPVLQPAM